jgi:hypothetical protein
MRTVLILVLLLMAGAVWGYAGPRPRYIEVEVTWKDAATGAERTSPGQLWFHDLPV